MNPRAPGILLTTIALLTLVAAVVLVRDAWQASGPPAPQRVEFQQLVGGLGLGPDVDLARCAFSFDPRLSAACRDAQSPVCGGFYFCPRHGCSILFLPQPQARVALPLEVPPDASIR